MSSLKQPDARQQATHGGCNQTTKKGLGARDHSSASDGGISRCSTLAFCAERVSLITTLVAAIPSARPEGRDLVLAGATIVVIIATGVVIRGVSLGASEVFR